MIYDDNGGNGGIGNNGGGSSKTIAPVGDSFCVEETRFDSSCYQWSNGS